MIRRGNRGRRRALLGDERLVHRDGRVDPSGHEVVPDPELEGNLRDQRRERRSDPVVPETSGEHLVPSSVGEPHVRRNEGVVDRLRGTERTVEHVVERPWPGRVIKDPEP